MYIHIQSPKQAQSLPAAKTELFTKLDRTQANHEVTSRLKFTGYTKSHRTLRIQNGPLCILRCNCGHSESLYIYKNTYLLI